MRHLFWILLLACLGRMMIDSPVEAVELWSDEETQQKGALDITGKWSSLSTEAPKEETLFPERCTTTELFRLRFDLNVKHNERLNSEVAYEHRAQWLSEKGVPGFGGVILPPLVKAPYRLTQLDWQIERKDDTLFYRHELDRILAAYHPDWGEVTVGRQAIGMGRGVLFGALDIFAPFSPLEVDREWRRGVDAVRVERRYSDTGSVEFIGAFGESWDESAVLGRARDFFGNLDAQVVWGKRARDCMIGTALSAVVGDAETHMELALFRMPEEQPASGILGSKELVEKIVAGGSYTFDIGNGLTLLGEYHYSGFGVKDITDAFVQLQNKDFRERFLRGDTQIIGRHALAGQASYLFNESLSGSFLVLQSPVDGSGVASPSLVWDIADYATFITSVFIPWGQQPSGLELKSEYGATALSIFLQLNLYY